jgi:hypothetical protein
LNDSKIRALDTLRYFLPKGSQVTVVVRTVSRSGMLRRVSVLRPGMQMVAGEVRPVVDDITGLVALALGYTRDTDGCIPIRGAGFSAGVHLTGNLSYALYQDDYALVPNTL